MKFFLLFLCFLPAITFSDLAADREALIRLSSVVRGNTVRWNTSQSPCSWDGVKCDNATNRVVELRLPGDGLSGAIPENSIGNLTELRSLSLRRNLLSGQLPMDLGSCVNLQRLFLQNNRFSGEIPATLFRLSNLVILDISGNSFSGELSQGFNNLTRLKTLYLQNNNFNGSIPDLSPNLSQLNVSFNRLNGSIPPRFANLSAGSFTGNTQLCGAPLTACPGTSPSPRPSPSPNQSPNGGESNKLSPGAIAGIVIGSVVGFIMIIVIVFILCRNCGNERNTSGPGVGNGNAVGASSIPPSPEKPPEYGFRSPAVMEYNTATASDGFPGREEYNDEMVFFGEERGGFLLEDLLRASAEVLGKGITGTTYKAYLDGGNQVIVKRLKNVCVSEREFREVVERLGGLNHENLLPLRGYYYGREEKLLIFDFMPIGSLSSVLHGNKGADIRAAAALIWDIRSTVAFQIAVGLEYLHSHNVPHGNIKSLNILLNHQYRAFVSEFGLNRLVSSSNANLNGYRPPEMVDTRMMSREADVYSFGVLLLELLTGKEPTDTLMEEGMDLSKWVQSVPDEKWSADVFDPNLLKYPNIEQQVMRLLRLGICCAAQVPNRRPSMTEVVHRIKNICKF